MIKISFGVKCDMIKIKIRGFISKVKNKHKRKDLGLFIHFVLHDALLSLLSCQLMNIKLMLEVSNI